MRGHPVSASQWDAARQVLEGAPPTRARVAAMIGIDVTPLYNHAAKNGWKTISFRGRQVVDKYREAAEFARRLQADDDPDQDSDDEPWTAVDVASRASTKDRAEGEAASEALALDGAESLDPLEMLARGSAFVSRQIGRLIARADRKGGRLDKAEIEGLVSLSRMMERWEALARDRAKENQIQSDAELAEILQRIDTRIFELAKEYAEDIVAERLGEAQSAGREGAAGR